MAVAILVQNLHNGGAERMAANLSMELSRYYTVYMIVFDSSADIYPYGGKKIDLKVPPLAEGTFLQRIYNTLLRVRKLRYYKKKYGINCTVSHMGGANLVNILSGGRKLSVYHSMPSMEFTPNLKNRIAQRFIAAFSDAYLMVSRLAVKDMKEQFHVPAGQLSCIYNFLDIRKARNLSEEPVGAEAERFFASHDRIFLTAGRLIAMKSQQRLIRILAELRKEGKNTGLVILGEGEERERLEKLAESLGIRAHVWMPGEVKNPFSYMRRADAFVLCSDYEGLPMVMIEAAACGCPVVSCDMRSGAREILAPDTEITKVAAAMEYAKYGILTPPCNGEPSSGALGAKEILLKDAIHNMLYEEKVRERYTERLNEAAERFSQDKIIAKWRELIGKA